MSITSNAIQIRFSRYPGDVFPQTEIGTDVNITIAKDFKMNIGLEDTSNFIRFDNTEDEINIYGNTKFHGTIQNADGSPIGTGGGGGNVTVPDNLNIDSLNITNSNNNSSIAYIQSKSLNDNTVAGIFLGTHTTADVYKTGVFMKPIQSGIQGNGELHFALATSSSSTSNVDPDSDTKMMIGYNGGVTAKRFMVSQALRQSYDDSLTALEIRHEKEPLNNYITCIALRDVNNVETNVLDFMVDFRGNVTARSVYQTSDDRVKTDEEFIIDALSTISKLRPQYYKKWDTIDKNNNYVYESGLIAQEVYYDVPELRHIVKVSGDIESNVLSSIDPTQDPDYSSWGSNLASVNYTGLIPYLVKGLQEANEKISLLQDEIDALKS